MASPSNEMPFGRAVEAGEADVRARRSVRAIGNFEQGSAATIGRVEDM